MNKIVDKDSLEKIAQKYHLNPNIKDKDFDEIFHGLCFDWAEEFIHKDDCILEMGYGEGNVCAKLLAKGLDVEIIEGSKSLVLKAQEIFNSQVLVHHALFSEFFPKKKYDVIFATNILEHVDNPIETLQAIASWCNKDTKVILTVPNAESIHRRLAVLMGIQKELNTLSPRDHVVGHQRVYTYQELIDEVTGQGFQVKKAKGFLLKVLPNSMMQDFSQDLISALYAISDQLDITHAADIALMIQLKQ
jgi:2-polyprenyl-3-methyl-5-hydroxy-6-metoxy-1,4-benzoquinol methylase